MRKGGLHIHIVTLILIGPVVTLIAGLLGAFDFVFYIFPVTVDSINLIVDPEECKELRIAGLIFPIFNIKIIIFGLIALTKLIRKTADSNFLKRLYIMTLFVTSSKLLMLIFYYDNSADLYYFIGLFGHSLWATGLVGVIKHATHNTIPIIHRRV